MSKEKQIEELTNELIFTARCGTHTEVAKYLYNKGYRKQSEPFSRGHEKGGEWIEHRETRPYEEVCYICSRCGRKEYQKEPYCHCGAKMKGGAE